MHALWCTTACEHTDLRELRAAPGRQQGQVQGRHSVPLGTKQQMSPDSQVPGGEGDGGKLADGWGASGSRRLADGWGTPGSKEQGLAHSWGTLRSRDLAHNWGAPGSGHLAHSWGTPGSLAPSGSCHILAGLTAAAVFIAVIPVLMPPRALARADPCNSALGRL